MRQTRRHQRYALRGVQWHKSSLERVRKCGKVAMGDVAITNNAGVAHFVGLTTCGSIWACPVCSAKIRNIRAEEISGAAARWDLGGNSVYMATFSAPHDLGMVLECRPCRGSGLAGDAVCDCKGRRHRRLKDCPSAPAPCSACGGHGGLLPVIANSFRAVISGGAWVKLKKKTGIVGTIRSVEVTHGVNGWHPHLHVLVFTEDDPGADGLVQLARHFREKWKRAIVKAGYRPPSDLHGVKVERCMSAAEAGAYIAKTQDGKAPGNELARGDLKSGRNGHRTPFQILEDFSQTGDAADLALWHEYEQATKGHQAITWSKGLRALLAAPERSDEEIAAEEVGGEVIAMIPAAVWREVVKVPGLPAHLLDKAEEAGAEAVAGVLERYLRMGEMSGYG